MSTSFEIGRQAEAAAANYLQQKGYRLLARNWRTRYCEIDLVAHKAGVVYLVEVKYRRNAAHGSGLEAVTPAKLRQMHQAARFWMQSNRWHGACQLVVVAVEGPDYRLAAFIRLGA